MMKKTLLALSLLGLSGNALAIENGTSELSVEFPFIIKAECTGTIIASKWVMTAAHCNGLTNTIKLVGAESTGEGNYVGKQISILQQIANPLYETEYTHDFALWELARSPEIDKILLLSNTPVKNDPAAVIQVYGFGQTGNKLNSAKYQLQFDPWLDSDLIHLEKEIDPTDLTKENSGTTVPGDSGSPYIMNNKIVAVHNGSIFDGNTHLADGSRIEYSAPFILSTIDAWHSQTIGSVAAGQSTTFEVQSLHVNSVVDDASVTGDINIDVANSSCMTGQIEPFGICTYTVSSTNGYEGALTLGAGQAVIFNKGKSKPVEPPKPDTGGSSGGSLGIFSLLGLVSLLFTRRKTIC